jgi:polyisoprenoid-binding protein YceI
VQVRSRLFLHAKRHPTMTFQSRAVATKDGGLQIRGLLTVKGNQAPVEITVDQNNITDSLVEFKAHGEVDRYSLGVSAFKGMAARKLTFEINASAVRI